MSDRLNYREVPSGQTAVAVLIKHGLGVRSYNTLLRYGFASIEDLLDGIQMLPEMYSVGPGTVEEVLEVLHAAGYLRHTDDGAEVVRPQPQVHEWRWEVGGDSYRAEWHEGATAVVIFIRIHGGTAELPAPVRRIDVHPAATLQSVEDIVAEVRA